MEDIILTASTAPSGAHKQPWTFCVVSDSIIKKQIRIEAEKEEFESYNGRMLEEWLKNLRPLQTDWHKEFLEKASGVSLFLNAVMVTLHRNAESLIYKETLSKISQAGTKV